MNEVEFVLRRILKVGSEYANQRKQEPTDSPALALHRYKAQLALLNYLEEQFLERNENGKQD